MHKNRIDLNFWFSQQQQVKYPQFWVSWVGTKKALIRPIWVSRQMLARWIARLWLVSGSNEGKNSIVVCVEQSILYHKEFAQCIKIHQNDSFPFSDSTFSKSIEKLVSGNCRKNDAFLRKIIHWIADSLLVFFLELWSKNLHKLQTKSETTQSLTSGKMPRSHFKTPIVWGEKSMEENLDFFSWNNI